MTVATSFLFARDVFEDEKRSSQWCCCGSCRCTSLGSVEALLNSVASAILNPAFYHCWGSRVFIKDQIPIIICCFVHCVPGILLDFKYIRLIDTLLFVVSSQKEFQLQMAVKLLNFLVCCQRNIMCLLLQTVIQNSVEDIDVVSSQMTPTNLFIARI